MEPPKHDLDVELSDPDLGFFQQEVFWVEQFDFLLAQGYRLRARYQPGVLREWIVKWRAGTPLTGTTWKEIEDVTTRPAAPHMTSAGIDAIRLADGMPVFIKCLWSQADAGLEWELHLNQFLIGDGQGDDSRNPCAPLQASFTQIVGDERRRYLVFPFLRRIRMSPFRLAVELMDFAQQMLEGLAFLHAHGIAHRDIHLGNVSMDSTTMWPPHGPRPLRSATRQFDVSEERPSFDRIDVKVKYFIIDLGLSSKYKPGQPRSANFEAGVCIPPEAFDGDTLPSLKEIRAVMRQVQNGGELPLGTPEWTNRLYDPFPADVFAMGVMLKDVIDESVPALWELLDAMTASDPQHRPTAKECLNSFLELAKGMTTAALVYPATDLSVEYTYSGAWWVFFSSRAVIRHWLEWARLATKYILNKRHSRA
ncbi:kinase-like domain-containing protein, partial [Auriculariales sp. MPI-PUGE-AT-0066]